MVAKPPVFKEYPLELLRALRLAFNLGVDKSLKYSIITGDQMGGEQARALATSNLMTALQGVHQPDKGEIISQWSMMDAFNRSAAAKQALPAKFYKWEKIYVFQVTEDPDD
jgi:hypothetical protein